MPYVDYIYHLRYNNYHCPTPPSHTLVNNHQPDELFTALGQHDPTSITQQSASVGRSGLTSATTKNVNNLEAATRQMSIERREAVIVWPSIESGDKVPAADRALNSNRAHEEEDDESDVRPPMWNSPRRFDQSIRRHAKRSITDVEQSSESEGR